MNENVTGRSLPMMALDQIPTPKPNAKSIKALVKDGGRVVGYQLSDDMIVSKEEGVNLAISGDIKGVGVAHRKENSYFKSLPDGSEENNLGNLPSISNKNSSNENY